MTWTLYKEIKYASDGIPDANLTDFPKRFLISTDTDIAAELGSGGGIKFTSADGNTDLSFGLRPDTNLAAGTVHAIVKIPSLLTAATVGDVICRLYYSASESTTEDKAGAVSSCALFMPLEEDPSGSAPQMYDWASESNIGTSKGSMTSGDLEAAQVGNGLDFDGFDDAIDTTITAGVLSTGRATMMGWANFLDENFKVAFGFSSAGFDDFRLILSILNTGVIRAFCTDGSGTGRNLPINVKTGSALQHYAIVVDDTEMRAYLDGVYVDSVAKSSGLLTTGTVGFAIGYQFGRNSLYHQGVVDEVWLYNDTISPEAIAYQYIDDSANDDTFTLSAEQGGGDTFTATAALQTGGAAFAASASHTPPTFEATAALETGGAAFAAEATHTAPTFEATADLATGGATLAATASHTAPTFAATASLETGGVAFAAEGTHAAAIFAATADLLVGGATLAAEATHTAPVFTATAALVCGAVQFAALETVPTTITLAVCRMSYYVGVVRQSYYVGEPQLSYYTGDVRLGFYPRCDC